MIVVEEGEEAEKRSKHEDEGGNFKIFKFLFEVDDDETDNGED